MVFDLTNENTFKNVKTWLESIYQNADVNIQKVLVGNKCDLEDERQVSSEEARELAAQHKMEYFETSAKTNVGITEAVQHIFAITYNKLYVEASTKAVAETRQSQGGVKLQNNLSTQGNPQKEGGKDKPVSGNGNRGGCC